jgi:hypothetical protein
MPKYRISRLQHPGHLLQLLIVFFMHTYKCINNEEEPSLETIAPKTMLSNRNPESIKGGYPLPARVFLLAAVQQKKAPTGVVHSARIMSQATLLSSSIAVSSVPVMVTIQRIDKLHFISLFYQTTALLFSGISHTPRSSSVLNTKKYEKDTNKKAVA